MPARASASAALALSPGLMIGSGVFPGSRSQASLILRSGPGSGIVSQAAHVIVRQTASGLSAFGKHILVLLLPLVDLCFGHLELAGQAVAIRLRGPVGGLELGDLARMLRRVPVLAPASAGEDPDCEHDDGAAEPGEERLHYTPCSFFMTPRRWSTYRKRAAPAKTHRTSGFF